MPNKFHKVTTGYLFLFRPIDKAFKAEKHIQDYVFTDGYAEKSVERRFAEDLDAADEVCVYAKLPRGFHIPTPIGNYSPDWAIAFNEGKRSEWLHRKICGGIPDTKDG